MRRFVAAVALGALSACGGGSGSSNSITVTSLATKLGCTGLAIEAENTQREIGAREEGACTHSGDKVTILTYHTNSARDAANSIAKESGGIAVLGDRWTVRVNTDASAKAVKAKLGGTLA